MLRYDSQTQGICKTHNPRFSGARARILSFTYHNRVSSTEFCVISVIMYQRAPSKRLFLTKIVKLLGSLTSPNTRIVFYGELSLGFLLQSFIAIVKKVGAGCHPFSWSLNSEIEPKKIRYHLSPISSRIQRQSAQHLLLELLNFGPKCRHFDGLLLKF